MTGAYRRVSLIVAGAVAVVTLVGPALRSADTANQFVTRSGSSFTVGGKAFRFVGFNLYDAAASDSYSCSPSTRLSDRELRDAMSYIHDQAGATVVRFWAYQTYTAGGRDFSSVDRVITAARQEGLRVIPVLEDGPGHCSTGQNAVPKIEVDGDTWFTAGYRRPYGSASLSYRDYVKAITRHYRDTPTILAWMMMNEAETKARDAVGRTALAPFAADIARVIHSVDSRHLVTLGTQSNGAPGSSGPDFRAIYSQPGLDFAEVHDWAFYGDDTRPLPGSVGGHLPDPASGDCQSASARIACSFAIAKQLHKPLLVGEAGIHAGDGPERSRRATQLKLKMSAAFRFGAAGYLVWQLNVSNTDGYAVIPGQKDPLIPALAAQSRRL